MSGHIIVRSLHTTEPATTSRRALTGVLREKWGYQGLIVTDALNMQGVQRRHRGARVAVAAVIAGADVLLMRWGWKYLISAASFHAVSRSRKYSKSLANLVFSITKKALLDSSSLPRTEGCEETLSRLF